MVFELSCYLIEDLMIDRRLDDRNLFVLFLKKRKYRILARVIWNTSDRYETHGNNTLITRFPGISEPKKKIFGIKLIKLRTAFSSLFYREIRIYGREKMP